jgi:sugar-specific transcriptional regulator TrmB
MTTINDNLIGLLTEIGFSGNESKVYLAALELGPSSIWEIAKHSTVKRPTCYVILEDLAYKGLASSSNDGKRVVYAVVSPKQLAQYQQRKFEKFNASIGQLLAIADQYKEKPKITTYEGFEGIRQVFLNSASAMDKDDTIFVHGANLLTGEYQSIIQELFLIRKKRHILTKGIYQDNSENRTVFVENAHQNRQVRFLPKEKFNPSTQVNVFGDTVAYIVLSENEPFATVIESKALAHDEREKFDFLWTIGVK